MNRLLIKLTSSKVLITIAAIVLLYIIVLNNLSAFKEVAVVCAGVIPAYLTVNVVQKKVEDYKHDWKEEEK